MEQKIGPGVPMLTTVNNVGSITLLDPVVVVPDVFLPCRTYSKVYTKPGDDHRFFMQNLCI